MHEIPHHPHYEGCGFYECPTPPEFIIYETGKADVSHAHACAVHTTEVLRDYLDRGIEQVLVGKHEPERCN